MIIPILVPLFVITWIVIWSRKVAVFPKMDYTCDHDMFCECKNAKYWEDKYRTSEKDVVRLEGYLRQERINAYRGFHYCSRCELPSYKAVDLERQKLVEIITTGSKSAKDLSETMLKSLNL